MPMGEPRYVEECLQLKERYQGRLTSGSDSKAIISRVMKNRLSELNDYPWDYVIGSVHFLVNGILRITVRPKAGSKDPLEGRYYDAVQKAAATGYDIMGHLDVIKRFGYGPGPEQKPEVIALSSALAAVAQSGSHGAERLRLIEGL